MHNKRILVVTFIDTIHPISKLNPFDNIGNNVFGNAINSYFFSNGINSTFITYHQLWETLSKDNTWVDNNFDVAILAQMNLFIPHFLGEINNLTYWLNFVHKPIFILGAGTESTIDYSLDFLPLIQNQSNKLIDLIYSRGGQITARGEFTKEVLELMGAPNVFVSGCPSMYFNGPNFQVTNLKVASNEFIPIFNGKISTLIDYNNKYPNSKSAFYEQECFYYIIHEPENLTTRRYAYDISMLPNYDDSIIRNGLVKIFLNYKQWSDDIINSHANFSFGNRVHGNIIALLSGVPAFIDVKDSRTREIAEFYNIPNSIDIKYQYSPETLYDLYSSLDWTKFNENYKVKFEAFDQFLKKNNLINTLKNNYEYKEQQSKLEFTYPSQESINQILDQYAKHTKRWAYFADHPFQKAMIRCVRALLPTKQMRDEFYIFACGSKNRYR